MSSENMTLEELLARVERLESEKGAHGARLDEIEREKELVRRVEAGEIPSLGEFQQGVYERQVKRLLEARERQRMTLEARAAARAATAKERAQLDAAMAKLEAEERERLEQHDRSRRRIVEGFADKREPLRVRLAELDAIIEKREALVAHAEVKVKMPRIPRLVGRDVSDALARALADQRAGKRVIA